MPIEDLITAAKKRVEDIGDPGEDAEKQKLKAAAEAQVEALENAKSQGYTKTQDDLNALDKKLKEEGNTVKDRLEKMFGTDLESVEKVMTDLEQMIVGDDDSGAGGDGDKSGQQDNTPLLARLQSELKDRDTKIEGLTTSQQEFQRSILGERVQGRVHTDLDALGLDKTYRGPAHTYAEKVVGYGDLIDKAMKGEEVTDEEIRARTERVKKESAVWFTAVPNPDFPGIPPTDTGEPPEQITDEQRRQRMTPVY